MTSKEKTLKKDLEKRMFAPRIELSDDLMPPKKETVTVDDIVEFLRLSAKSHRRLFHYTKIGCLGGMLRSRKLYLSRLSEMNDLLEYTKTPDANRIYIASFSYGSCENMAMWKMYGGLPSESVRLGFEAKYVIDAIGERDGHSIYKVCDEKSSGKEDKGNIIHINEVEDWSFHDVAYKYGNALYWNHNVIGTGRCRELQNAFSVKEFATYVKNSGWMSENEVRLTIKLRTHVPGLRQIAVDFEEPIKNMSIIIGPEKDKGVLIDRLVEDYPIRGSIVRSEYKVDLK